MGYTGTIVVGWSARLLVHEDGIDEFGHQHRYVRPLGDGWQLVETGGRIKEPDLRAPCRRLATSTGRPVLAAHVFDSDYALLGTDAGPVTRLADVPVTDLVDWSTAAGLSPDSAALHAAVTEDQLADDAVFAVVRALGVTTIGRTLPRAFPVASWPFSPISGMAYSARTAEPWVLAAVELDAELWAAAYRPQADVASLARRAVDVLAERRLALGRADERQDDHDLVNRLLAEGRLGPEPVIAADHNRKWADRRAG